MNQEVFNKIHSQLTSHVNFKEVQTLKNKNRYFFERLGESATIQIPKNEQAKFLYTYSDEEEGKVMSYWLQYVIEQCQTQLQKATVTEPVTPRELFKETPQKVTVPPLTMEQGTSLDLPVLLKGIIETEEQRLLVKKLIQSGFEVFPDED